MSIRRWLRTSSIVQCFACILLVAAASAQSTETTDVQEPQNNGVYYLSSEGWIPMQHVLAFAKGHQHVLRGVIPPFVMQQTIRFRGAEAPVKVNDLKPTFLLKGSVVAGGGSARDVVLVRLDQR